MASIRMTNQQQNLPINYPIGIKFTLFCKILFIPNYHHLKAAYPIMCNWLLFGGDEQDLMCKEQKHLIFISFVSLQY